MIFAFNGLKKCNDAASAAPPRPEDVGSSVEYGVPARPWAVGTGSRRAVYSVLVQLLAV